MTRTKGLLGISANWEPQIAAPFDAREVVETLADLTNTDTFKANDGNVYVYVGLGVKVINDGANNGLYILNDLDYTDIGNWSKVGTGGAVDSVNGETGVVVLDADDIDDSTTANKFVTADDITNLGNLSGTNTGDQVAVDVDITDAGGYYTSTEVEGALQEIASKNNSKADKTNVLELDNTTEFTPDSDYEPATKKYVDDNAGGTGGVSFELNRTLTAGDLVQILNDGKIDTIYKSEPTGYGNIVNFNENKSDFLTATQIADNKVFAVYIDAGNSNKSTGIVISVSGNTITYGTSAVFFDSATTLGYGLCKLDDNKVLIHCAGTTGYTCIGTISGTDITYTETVYNKNKAYSSSLFNIGKDKAVFVFCDGNNNSYGTAQILSVDGTTITSGANTVYSSTFVLTMAGCHVDEDKIIISYSDGGNSFYGKAIVGIINGTSISFGSPKTYRASKVSEVSICKVNTDKFVTSYKDEGNNNYGTASVLSISGTTVSNGTASVFNSGITANNSCAKITDDKIMLVYSNGGSYYRGTSRVATISSLSLSYGTATENIANNCNYTDCIPLEDNKTILLFNDIVDTAGKSVVYQMGISIDNIGGTAGVLIENGNVGENKKVVLLGGVASGFTGLTPGTIYYVQDDGTIGTGSTSYKLGRAISATQINTTFIS